MSNEAVRRIVESSEFKEHMERVDELIRAADRCLNNGMEMQELEDLLSGHYGRIAGPETLERMDEVERLSYPEYLTTPEWRRHKELAEQRFKNRCAACDRAVPLEVHHRTYENKPYEQPEDLLPLCAACHTAVHLPIDARKGKVRKSSRRDVA